MKQGKVCFLLAFFLFVACAEDKSNYFALGKKSFQNGNYPLAKSQFLSVKSDDPNYVDVKFYLKQIDSIDKSRIQSNSITDSLNKSKAAQARKKFEGNYKIEVTGVSSKKEVEIYQLESNGKAQWLWVYYNIDGKGYVDDRKIGTWIATENSLSINIQGNSGMISETFVVMGDNLVHKTLSKRKLEKTTENY